MSTALQAGEWERVAALWAQVPAPDGQASPWQQQAWAWLDKHLEDPRMVRWGHQSGYAGEEVERLGHMESQMRALIAHRMKGKGRHWSAQGLGALEVNLWQVRACAYQTEIHSARTTPIDNVVL